MEGLRSQQTVLVSTGTHAQWGSSNPSLNRAKQGDQEGTGEVYQALQRPSVSVLAPEKVAGPQHRQAQERHKHLKAKGCASVWPRGGAPLSLHPLPPFKTRTQGCCPPQRRRMR